MTDPNLFSPINIDTSGLKKVPNPLDGDGNNRQIKLPAVGVPLDEDFGRKVMRVTESAVFRHEYSRFDPFNKDKSMIILRNVNGGFKVFLTNSLPYDKEENCVRDPQRPERSPNLPLQEPRWDRDNPNLVIRNRWGDRTQDRQVRRYNLGTAGGY